MLAMIVQYTWALGDFASGIQVGGQGYVGHKRAGIAETRR